MRKYVPAQPHPSDNDTWRQLCIDDAVRGMVTDRNRIRFASCPPSPLGSTQVRIRTVQRTTL